MKSVTAEQDLMFRILAGEAVSLPLGFDPSVFILLLQRHKLLPLAELVLPELPDAVKTEFKSQLVAWAARSMLLFEELKTITQVAVEHQFDLISVKGPVLSYQLFGNVHGRYYTDLDIILAPAKLFDFVRLLESKGYVMRVPNGIEGAPDWKEHAKFNNDIVLVNRAKNISLEVHFGIHIEQLLGEKEAALILSDPEILSIEGKDFLCLGKEENFLYLCLHASKHMFFRLNWLRDIAEYLRVVETDHAKVLILAEKSGLDKILALSLKLVSTHFGESIVPSEYADLLQRYKLRAVLRWSDTIIKGPGELVYEGFFRLRKKQEQIKGIDKVTFRHFLVQIGYLLALRKGFRRKMHFLFYQFRKRT